MYLKTKLMKLLGCNRTKIIILFIHINTSRLIKLDGSEFIYNTRDPFN